MEPTGYLEPGCYHWLERRAVSKSNKCYADELCESVDPVWMISVPASIKCQPRLAYAALFSLLQPPSQPPVRPLQYTQAALLPLLP